VSNYLILKIKFTLLAFIYLLVGYLLLFLLILLISSKGEFFQLSRREGAVSAGLVNIFNGIEKRDGNKVEDW